jgi:hypothetical protein
VGWLYTRYMLLLVVLPLLLVLVLVLLLSAIHEVYRRPFISIHTGVGPCQSGWPYG